MKKVLHIYKSYYPETYGGIEQSIHTLTSATASLGIKNSLLTTTSPSLPTQQFCIDDTLEIIRMPTTFSIASCPFSASLFNKFMHLAPSFDCIHLHFPWPYGELITLLLAKTQHNIIITYHADITRQKYLKMFYQPFMHSLLKRVQSIVATSPNLLNTSPVLQRYRNKTHVIPLTLNLTEYNSSPASSLRQYWQQQVGKNFLLFIGQFRYYKGIHVLLSALQTINVPCVLVGDGELLTDAQALSKQLELKHIHFVGAVSDADKIALLELSYAIVLPSIARSEAFGIALLEGLAFGKPLISTELGTGTSFVNQHGITGLIVPPNDSIALRNAILQLFNDKALSAQMSAAAKQHFQQNFQLSQVAEKYQQLYG